MNVIDLVRAALIAAKADGLCNVDIECGCTLEDLAPCDAIGSECEAAEKVIPCRSEDECECDYCGAAEGLDFVMVAKGDEP